MTVKVAQALGKIPRGLRDELVSEFGKITRNFRESRWEAAELNSGKFCEVVYTILAGHLNGDNFPSRASKPNRFDQACKALESADPQKYSDSARLTIPRILPGLYDVRNRRGVGHVGGDVDANRMDAAFVLHAAQWIISELVRIFHDTDIDTATAIVNALVDRTAPLVWAVGEVRRVLDTSLTLKDATLLLLYSDVEHLTDRQLSEFLEQKRLSDYRKVLRKLHADRLAEYNPDSGIVTISPKGIAETEERILTRP